VIIHVHVNKLRYDHTVVYGWVSDTGSLLRVLSDVVQNVYYVQGGSNMTGTDLCVNKPHCAAAVRP